MKINPIYQGVIWGGVLCCCATPTAQAQTGAPSQHGADIVRRLQPDYPVPYAPASVAEISAVLGRVVDYLDTASPVAVLNAETQERVAAQGGVDPPKPETKEAAFDQLWNAFDQDYAMFVLRPEVDWNKLRDQYRPKAFASQSAGEFARACAQMLQPLRDLHIWLTVGGQTMPVFNRPRSANSNPFAHALLLGAVQGRGAMRWAVAANQVGYIVIDGWNDATALAQFDRALEQMRNTRGLIVDVRLNGGGSENLAMEVAGRFIDKEFVYGYDRVRNGSSHTNLTEKRARTLGPRGPWRYNRPVILLIGQKCMSSNESFVGMMTGDPDLLTMGDHTCGSSGNPENIKLPMNMTVSVPRWIDYLPDGTVLDEHGFQPQIQFDPQPGAFDGDRDDLLSAALQRLGQAPLPDKPIAGPVAMSAEPGEEVQAHDIESLPPVVVKTVPESGAKEVNPGEMEIRVTFSKKMSGGSWSWATAWDNSGPASLGRPHYEADQKTCVMKVRLEPNKTYGYWLNSPDFQNFRDAQGHPAVPYLLVFETKAE
jgi:hypothetical protein